MYKREHAYIKICVWDQGKAVFVFCESVDECLCVHMCAENRESVPVIVVTSSHPGFASTERGGKGREVLSPDSSAGSSWF